jgi:hypothetical protein
MKDWVRQLTCAPTGTKPSLWLEHCLTQQHKSYRYLCCPGRELYRTGVRAIGIVNNELDSERNRRFSGAYKCQGLIRTKYIGVVLRGFESEVGSLRLSRQRILFSYLPWSWWVSGTVKTGAEP